MEEIRTCPEQTKGGLILPPTKETSDPGVVLKERLNNSLLGQKLLICKHSRRRHRLLLDDDVCSWSRRNSSRRAIPHNAHRKRVCPRKELRKNWGALKGPHI